VVAVIGATGAQGRPIVQHLVQDGAYRVRALTRDPKHRRAQELTQLGPPGHVELIKVSEGGKSDRKRGGFEWEQYLYFLPAWEDEHAMYLGSLLTGWYNNRRPYYDVLYREAR